MTHAYIYRESVIRAVTGSDRTDWLRGKLEAEKTAQRSYSANSYDHSIASKNIELLESTIESSLRNDAARTELHQQVEAKRVAEQKRDDAAALTSVVGPMKAAYMKTPGATEADFEKSLPTMLAQRREQDAINATSEFDKQIAAARATGKYSI